MGAGVEGGLEDDGQRTSQGQATQVRVGVGVGGGAAFVWEWFRVSCETIRSGACLWG